jgi:hypothetical protein
MARRLLQYRLRLVEQFPPTRVESGSDRRSPLRPDFSNSQKATLEVSLTWGFASTRPFPIAAASTSVPPLESRAVFERVERMTRKRVTTCCAPNCRAEAVFSFRSATTSWIVRR